MKNRILCSLMALFLPFVLPALHAQIEENNSKWMDYLQEMASSEVDENMLEELYNDLSYLADNPFNLHQIRQQDLERLPFLSSKQIENILYFLYRNSPLVSLYELRNVPQLDRKTLEYLLPFVRLEVLNSQPEALNPRKALRYAKQQVLLRYDRGLNQKAGYASVTDEEKQAHPSKYYVGEPFYGSVKYSIQYKDRIQAGWVAEKDAGEAFWNRQHKGSDYYSAHLFLQNLGKLDLLALGDYRVSFGQGLVVNTEFNMGITSDVLNVTRRAGGIKKHLSTGEATHFRGLATAFSLGGIKYSLFASQRYIDVTAHDSVLLSIKTDGLRRTLSDLLKKNQAKARVLGGNAQWKNDFLQFGVSALWYDYAGELLYPELKPYNVYYFRGTQNYNYGLDYSFRKKNFLLQGELARSKNGAWSYLTALQLYPASYCSVVLRRSSFSKEYQALYAAAPGFSQVQNASSWYVGAVVEPLAFWKLSASSEWIQHPWLRYQIDAPSRAQRSLVSIDYQAWGKFKASLRYTYRSRMKNTSSEQQITKRIVPLEQHALKWQMEYTPNAVWQLKWQAQTKWYKVEQEPTSKGVLFSQNLSYKAPKKPIQLDAFVAYFSTDDWDSRLSSYEKGVLYAFSMPTFYGEGLRSGTVLKYQLKKALSLYAKWSWTHYMDRNEIGSGPELIQGKDKHDLSLLLKLSW